MVNSSFFLRSILDSLTGSIAVIDATGQVVFVNESWRAFARDNGGGSINWLEVNYLSVCEQASLSGEAFGTKATNAIKALINQTESEFYLEYPCHSPQEHRWFVMRGTSFTDEGKLYCVISHQDVTERKKAEQKVRELAYLDGLTHIPNRLAFDSFLDQEWRRCSRLGESLSVAIVDIDYFKKLNDTYGHLAGDKALVRVAQCLKQGAQRPGDICARYGGEEFALVWAQTDAQQAKALAARLLSDIDELGIRNEQSAVSDVLTVSIGLATLVPHQNMHCHGLVAEADKALYQAKQQGRNRICTSDTAFAGAATSAAYGVPAKQEQGVTVDVTSS